uniref:Uncharacterized protein LOC111105945 n=1 Tax=Crassostrea virginica TaxID=6565 RepID=A0A8B8AYB6_CRAVI|nr:uncharacterized protein LOC111105945 [Crassostrea virginica]
MKANVSVGYSCFSSQQCTGTDFSGVCKNDVCHCQQEYLQLHETCYRANVHVGDTCSFQQQCNGTDHSGVCSHGFCQCQQGYLQKDRTCYRANVHVGDACSFQQQCNGTDHSGVCSYGFCQCQQGYLQKDGTCYRAVPLNWSCVHHLQCLGSPYAACLNAKCHCIAGYIAENSSHCVLEVQGSTSVHVSTLGILFGGFFLGAFVTCTVGIVFLIYQRLKSSGIKRTEPSVSITQKVYSLAEVVEFVQSGPSSPQNTMREVIIAPHKPPEYCYVSHKPQRQPRNEDIYNHLNEKEEQEDSNNYDHACAANFDIGDLSLYDEVQHKKHIPILPEVMNADINGYSTVKL